MRCGKYAGVIPVMDVIYRSYINGDALYVRYIINCICFCACTPADPARYSKASDYADISPRVQIGCFCSGPLEQVNRELTV